MVFLHENNDKKREKLPEWENRFNTIGKDYINIVKDNTDR